jgi:predicted dehydrogenase
LIGLHQITDVLPHVYIVGGGPWAKKIANVLEQSSAELYIQRIDARRFLEDTKSPNIDGSIIWLATRPSLQLSILKALLPYQAEILLDKPVVSDLAGLISLKELARQSKSSFRIVQTWRCSNLWNISSSPLSELHSIQIERNYADSREYISPALDWLPHDFSLLSDLGIKPYILSVDSLDLEKWGRFNLKAHVPSGTQIELSISKGDIRRSQWKLGHKSGSVRTIDFENRVTTLSNSSGKTIEIWNQPVTDHPIKNVITGIGMWGDADFQNQLEYYEWYFKHGGI